MSNFIPNKDYKRILENIPICCVDIIIVRDGKIFTVLRKNEPGKNTWCFPGGRIYKNELLEQAVIRKAKEESGLNVKIERKIGVYETMFPNEGPFKDLKTGVHTINLVFLASTIDDDSNIKIDETSEDYKWIDKIEEGLLSYAKEVITDSKIFN